MASLLDECKWDCRLHVLSVRLAPAGRFVDVIVGRDAVVACLFGELPNVLGVTREKASLTWCDTRAICS